VSVNWHYGLSGSDAVNRNLFHSVPSPIKFDPCSITLVSSVERQNSSGAN